MSICINFDISIKFVNYVKRKLGINYILAGSTEQWKNYDDWLKSNHPIFYKFEQTMDVVQDIVCYLPYKYKNIRAYIKNLIGHSNKIKTGLKSGQYYDFDTKVLHGLFYELVEYVEVECSVMLLDGEHHRSSERGLKYLDWCINETKQCQAESAKIAKELYLWWTVERPNRIDPDQLPINSDTISDVIAIKENNYKEDTQKLVELIKIRDSIWS